MKFQDTPIKPLLLIVCLFFCAGCLFACPRTNKPVPNSMEHARYNAECFANAINKGKKIKIDDTFYVSHCNILINKDIVITGNGTLVLVDSDIFIVNAPISVNIQNIKITTTLPKTYNSQIRFIVSNKRLFHKEVKFEDCIIEGVRVYTQIADDVDQITVKDGVKKFVFKGNKVYDTGYFIVRLGNCLCEVAEILDNRFTRMQSCLFDFGLDNDYQGLGFCRFEKVYFNNNIIDNEGILIAPQYNFLYCTPILAECDYAECKGNIIKSIISTSEKPIALYAFYLSSNSVVISGNEIIDCINLGNSTYNTMFKCKSGGDRFITNNRYVITKECLKKKTNNNNEVFTRFISFQSDFYGDVIISNNDIDVACDFVFGSGVEAEYRNFVFDNNHIKYHDLGSTAHQLLRLKPATKGDNTIVVRNNTMEPSVLPKSSHGLFAYNCTGYSITVTDNVLYGYLPYGDNETEVYSLRSGTSENNTVMLGTNTSFVRVSINNLNIKDRIISNSNYSIKLYNDSDSVSTHFTFEGQPPLSMVSNADVVYGTKPMFKGKQSITVWKGKAVIE